MRVVGRVAMIAVFVLVAHAPVLAQALTRDTATGVIRAALGALTVQTTVEGISQASSQSPEAVVLAKLGSSELRLHFRRYDTGWRWETTETDNGSQVAARITIAALGENGRQTRVNAWVTQNRAKYADTAETFWWWATNAPRLPKDDLTDEIMLERHGILALRTVPISNRTPQEKARLLKKLDPVPIDAWGQKLISLADSSKRTLTVSSAGPDGKAGTSDDFTCVYVGFKHFDEERSEILWDYRPSCSIPEGLADLASKVGGSGEPVVKASHVVN